MVKRQVVRTSTRRMAAAPKQRASALALKSAVNRQMRKLLGKHYRAKYGVK